MDPRVLGVLVAAAIGVLSGLAVTPAAGVIVGVVAVLLLLPLFVGRNRDE